MKSPDGNEHRSLLERAKVWVETIQGVVTIIALIAGGYWFYMQRSTKPQLKLEQTFTQRAVDGKPGLTFISVDVRVTNMGKVKVELDPGEVSVYQINPPSTDSGKPLAKFKLLKETLEPGESDQAGLAPLFVYDNIKTILVHSDYKVPNGRFLFWNLPEKNLYWNQRSYVDIGADTLKKESANSSSENRR
jgi:hypothetical protein